MGGSEGGLAVVPMQKTLHTNNNSSSNLVTNSSSNVSSSNVEMKSRNSVKMVSSDEEPNDNFPVGMRVLVVDDDPICLLLLEGLLRRCQYKVTTCGQAITALNLLRENKDKFDLVISDVYMPDMDGFKLLELVGLEMDLPVIMMSANGETSAVMKGITHGACDYLLKPVRFEELKNIWQHVIRKKRTDANSRNDQTHGDANGNAKSNRKAEDGEHTSAVNEGAEKSSKSSKKRKDQDDFDEEDENDHETEDPSTLKKPRVVWSVELHQQFVSAVNTLGIDKAVPKRILELMNVQGLTRENVASHLQKYRLYLKRLSGVATQQGGMGNSFGGVRDSPFASLGPVDGFSDLQALAQSGQLSPHSLASLQAGVFGRLNSSVGIGMPPLNSSGMLQYQSLPTFNINNSVGRTNRNAITINSPKTMPSCLSTMPEFSHLQQKQVSRVGDMGASIDDPSKFLALQHLSDTNTLAVTMEQGGAADIPVNQTNNALLLQLLQQQNRGLTNLSSESNFCQRQGPNNDNVGLSSLSNNNGFSRNWGNVASRPGLSAKSQPLAYHSNTPTNVDCKSIEVSAPAVGSLITPASQKLVTTRKDSGITSMTSIGDLSEVVSVENRQSNLPLFANANPGFKQDTVRGIKQDWETQMQNFRSLSNPLMNNQLGQSSEIVNQRVLEAYVAHSQGQNTTFCTQDVNLDAKNSVNSIAPTFSRQGGSEQQSAESRIKIKQEYPMNNLKSGSGLFTEPGNTGDDLMSILYKQQQEGFGFSDADSGLDAHLLKTCI
eukprot:TRINITY_DN25033_c0_g1_i1.p1 TRINITY_DN25033_c0_g1~~TRINITY_DN25033_c0_g1_i1.p1  ORF type:complete len:775 (-),score=137.61 TRINITY_DN25033_c0_g1_i1:681-3005(-)